MPAGTGSLDLNSIFTAHIAPLTRGRLDDHRRLVMQERYQWAVLAAFEGDQSSVHAMVNEYRRRRARVVELVGQCPALTGYEPGGAFFVMPSLPAGADGFDVAMRLLEETGGCTIPGGTFGESCNNALRISYSTSMENIEAAFERMIPWLAKQLF